MIHTTSLFALLLAYLVSIGWMSFELTLVTTRIEPNFPTELTQFTPYAANPVFSGTGTDSWDQKIRERGYILRENGLYHLLYTGYREGAGQTRSLGYATSTNGLNWTRYKRNPIHQSSWVEDMSVIKSGNTYFMFAEGRDDTAHLLTFYP